MHPPPPKEIVQRLANSDVELLGHGKYVVHLSFENGNRLSVYAPFRFAERKLVADSPICEFPLFESKLVRIVGLSVTQVACEADGTLELQFSNNDVLIVYANDPLYDAYTLLIDEKEYRV